MMHVSGRHRKGAAVCSRIVCLELTCVRRSNPSVRQGVFAPPECRKTLRGGVGSFQLPLRTVGHIAITSCDSIACRGELKQAARAHAAARARPRTSGRSAECR
jgi:hypothetical protein